MVGTLADREASRPSFSLATDPLAAWSQIIFRAIIRLADRPFRYRPHKMAHANILNIDTSIRSAIQTKNSEDAEYWSFRGRAKRDAAHALIQYPAMMVPQMQGEIIDIILSASPDIETLFDPFVGSGTILTEAMARGKDFIGFDINPLAILSSQTKAGPYYVAALDEKIFDLLARLDRDRSTTLDITFPGQEKWFKPEVSQALSRIRRCILREESKWARRFFWLSLVEAVRQCSNSRTSTFKLHIRAISDLENTSPDAQIIFRDAIQKNFDSYKKEAKQLQKSLNRGSYSGDVTVKLVDSVTTKEIKKNKGKIDLLVTSPPYGDNATTVPYGQFSFLALQWIDLQDIDSKISDDILKTTHEIDARSLGGSIRWAEEKAEHMSVISHSFFKTYSSLNKDKETKPHAKRLAAFCYDLEQSIINNASCVRSGGFMIWTLGDRNTGGATVPLSEIVKESLINAGAESVASIERSIPSKRMPKKNNVSNTMSTETTLIMRMR